MPSHPPLVNSLGNVRYGQLVKNLSPAHKLVGLWLGDSFQLGFAT